MPPACRRPCPYAGPIALARGPAGVSRRAILLLLREVVLLGDAAARRSLAFLRLPGGFILSEVDRECDRRRLAAVRRADVEGGEEGFLHLQLEKFHRLVVG